MRQVGVHITGLSSNTNMPLSLFEDGCSEKKRNLDNTIDSLRERFGKSSVYTANYLSSPISSFNGGVGEEDYPMMSSLL